MAKSATTLAIACASRMSEPSIVARRRAISAPFPLSGQRAPRAARGSRRSSTAAATRPHQRPDGDVPTGPATGEHLATVRISPRSAALQQLGASGGNAEEELKRRHVGPQARSPAVMVVPDRDTPGSRPAKQPIRRRRRSCSARTVAREPVKRSVPVPELAPDRHGREGLLDRLPQSPDEPPALPSARTRSPALPVPAPREPAPRTGEQVAVEVGDGRGQRARVEARPRQIYPAEGSDQLVQEREMAVARLGNPSPPAPARARTHPAP
jgi:hypothetical protein